MAQLELCVNSGIPFWEANLEPIQNVEDKEAEDLKNQDQTPYSLQTDEAESAFKNKLAEETVSKIAVLKKHRIQLITELDSIKDVFETWA